MMSKGLLSCTSFASRGRRCAREELKPENWILLLLESRLSIGPSAGPMRASSQWHEVQDQTGISKGVQVKSVAGWWPEC